MSAPFDIDAAAALLLAVRAGRAPRPASPGQPPDEAAACAVQDRVLTALGGRPSWKMALLGGRDVRAAAMPGAEILASGATLAGLPPDAAIEVETAFVLGRDLAPGGDARSALDAVAEVRLAFEIVGSRMADRTAITPLEAMADNFSSAAIVLGDPVADWRAMPDAPALWLDDARVPAPVQDQPVAATGAFLAWLAGHAAGRGWPLVAGTVVISGARIGPLPLGAARMAQARMGGASVCLRLGA